MGILQTHRPNRKLLIVGMACALGFVGIGIVAALLGYGVGFVLGPIELLGLVLLGLTAVACLAVYGIQWFMEQRESIRPNHKLLIIGMACALGFIGAVAVAALQGPGAGLVLSPVGVTGLILLRIAAFVTLVVYGIQWLMVLRVSVRARREAAAEKALG